MKAPDLTRQPPRSPRVRLGGYAILPRMLDKGRALLAGKNGEYNYACPLDQQYLSFAGIDAEALKRQLTEGQGDGEILEWINAHSAKKPSPAEIAAWTLFQENRAPGDVESRAYYHEVHQKMAPQRADLVTWFDLLDMDDYVSFGGQP